MEYEEPAQSSRDLWKKVTGVDPSNWKCLHGYSCDFDTINNIGVPSARYKREADPLFPKYAEWAEESMANLMHEVCNDDIAKCVHLINKRSTDYLSRDKRSADEDSLLEMALMTEGTYEATVNNVTTTSVTFTTPALPAGDYDIIISSEGQGNALSSLGSLTSVMEIAAVTPSEGSINGGQPITISGSGFCDDDAIALSL